MNHYDLAGQVAIITGGARGIGYAVAQRLLASEASVVLWDVAPDCLRRRLRRYAFDISGGRAAY